MKRELATKPEEGLLQIGTGDRVERAEGLVEQDHIGIGGERAGNRDPLALAAGELPRLPRGELRRVESHELERALASLVAVGHASKPRHEGGVAAHGQWGSSPPSCGT